MSRIDQALRRLTTESRGLGADTAEQLPESTSVLDQYPEEYPARVAAPVVPLHRPAEVPSSTSHVAVRAKDEPAASSSPDLDRPSITDGPALPDTVGQYRDLAVALEDLKSSQGLKRLVVTSALRGEGRTFTVVNLALMMSSGLDRRVLLLDADLQSPSVHSILRIPNPYGLSEWLRNERDSAPVFQSSERLAIVPAGRADSNAVKALASERMEDLVDQRSAEFDWILVDAPPTLDVDPAMFASIGGGVLFVIRAGSTPYAQVQRAIKSLGAHPIVGTVLNGVANAM